MSKHRQDALNYIDQNLNVSVLIIGAGINGIGTFRDLALQGVDVLMVDKGDFCSGTSAASSHMVHGGVRYLENGEFRLVREAVQERNRLIQNAPHYVQPLATTIPIFQWFSGFLNAPLKFLGLLDKPSERGGIIIKIGLMLYDAYTRSQSDSLHTRVPNHRFSLRKTSLAQYPQLNKDIVATATYFDAAMHSPERIGMELVLDAEGASSQAHAINYMSAVAAGDNSVTLRDELTGETYTIYPQLVINAAGPWIDLANQSLGQQTKFIGGTKGSHLVLDHPELRQSIDENEFFFENEDGRIVLIYPLKDKVLVGTSDIRVDSPEDIRCTDEEIDYFLSMIDRVFPDIHVDRSHIVYQFSGVRPLPSSDANTAGQISRDHSIRVIEPDDTHSYPIFNLIGGKWTTFRAFSEQTADKALEHLEQPRLYITRNMPIGGGDRYPVSDGEKAQWIANVAEDTELAPAMIEILFDRYGTRARAVAQYMADSADENDLASLQHQPDYFRGEIRFLAQHEKVTHLDDLILRRTLLGMLGHASAALSEEVGAIVGDTLKWSAETQAAEIERFRGLLAEKHGVTWVD
ncbi:MAG: glycerol-3-phosphate dehydrogenase/oxidase [Chloroflexota bacterium]